MLLSAPVGTVSAFFAFAANTTEGVSLLQGYSITKLLYLSCFTSFLEFGHTSILFRVAPATILTHGVSTAGLQIDYKRNRLLVAGFNGAALFDNNPKTKGVAHLRIYNLKTGVLEKDINLSSLLPKAKAYFANDVAIDKDGNAYISDWYAGVVYKVDVKGKPSIFWANTTGIKSGPNGIDFHPDGYLLVSILIVNKKGLYANYGLVKVPVNSPASAKVVRISGSGFTGFDGMVVTSKGNVIGVTNNGKTPGGNTLLELSSKDNWKSAQVIHSKSITPSTTVAITPKGKSYVINQDFSPASGKNLQWKIEPINF